MIKNFDDFTSEDELIETLEVEIERNDWKSLKGEKKEKLKNLLFYGALKKIKPNLSKEIPNDKEISYEN